MSSGRDMDIVAIGAHQKCHVPCKLTWHLELKALKVLSHEQVAHAADAFFLGRS